MTKKDYELFASKIHNLIYDGSLGLAGASLLINVTVEVFKQDNPAFNEDKYKEACHEGKHIRKAISGRV